MNDLPTLPAYRRFPRGIVLLATAVALIGIGCQDDVSPDDDEVGAACDLGFLPGDLVISEIMVDTEGKQWFEIYNASGEAVDLEGLVLVYTKDDGTGRKQHVVAGSLALPAGAYAVMGDLLPEVAAMTDHIDYGWSGELGDFVNSAGSLALECGGNAEIDQAYYEDPTSGTARVLDGAQAPDGGTNDDQDNWCDSRTAFGDGSLGTPGEVNDVCGGSPTCLVNGEPVDVLRPGVGDLAITEIHANPEAVGDMEGEWFEIEILADFDLNGLQIGRDVEDDADETIAAVDCLPVSAGDRVVVARSADEMINGGVPAEVIVWESGVSLKNSDGSLWLGSEGTILDVVTWAGVPTGGSTQLHPGSVDPSANDDLGNWCPATTPYGAGDEGTPGAMNEECAIEPPEGQCFDLDDQAFRDVDPVEKGDLVITELLPNPELVEDAEGEFFEVLVTGAGDLNGLVAGKGGTLDDTLVGGSSCVEVTAGQFILFGRNADPAGNGGLPPVDFEFDFALNNSNGDLGIGFEGELLPWDEVTWASSVSGQTRSLDPASQNPNDNDDEDNWCDDPVGTPAATNNACEGGGGDGECTDPDTNLPRLVNPPGVGDLRITEVMPNPDAVNDGDGEWFELEITGTIDLNGLQIGKDGVFSATVSDPGDMCIELAPGDYAVIVRSSDDATNGMIPNVTVQASISLSNSNSNLQVAYEGAVLSETSWTSSPAGVAHSLDQVSLEWCGAVDVYGLGDLGTPGAANPDCDGGGGEGQCLDGIVMRDTEPPSLGDLVITEIMANPAAVTDTNGEWFELRALGAFDLNDVQLGKVFADGALETVQSPACIEMVPGDVALLARNADGATNGQLPDVDYEFSFSLNNSNSGLFVGFEDALLDEVSWTSVANGSSTSLDPDNYDPAVNDAAANDGVIWCYSDLPFAPDADEGTPRADNLQCE